MPSCVQVGTVSTQTGSVSVLVPAAAPCADGYVVFASSEYAALQQQIQDLQMAQAALSQLPPPADIAAAWGAGFTIVVGCYAIARTVGAVVNFIK